MLSETLVIWDWDNTLNNTKNSVHKGLNDTMRHFGFPPVTEEDVINVMTNHRGAFWQARFKLEADENGVSLPTAIEYYVNCYQKYSDETALFDDALEALDFVRQMGANQVVLSNKNHQSLVEEVKDKGVFDYFKIVKGTTGPVGKPDMEFIEPILETLKPKKIIFVGDGVSDMLMAQKINATAILVHHKDDVPHDYYCNTLAEVKNLISQLMG